MFCSYCKEEITDGLVRNGYSYCSEKHAEKDWEESKADQYATEMSQGRYRNFEEYVEHDLNGTIAGDIDYLEREY